MTLDQPAGSPDHPAGTPARRPRRPVLLALALVLTLGGSACAGDGNDRADTESVDPASAAADGAVDTDDGDASDDGGSDEAATDGAAVEPGSGGGTGEVLGTARAQLTASPGNATLVPLRADVTRLERHGELVELSVTLTNENTGESNDDTTFEPWTTFQSDGAGNYDVSGIALVDPEGQKLYLPARDSEGACLCTDDLDDVPVAPGADPLLVSATIGGVPEDVEQVDVSIPGFPTIVGVPIR